VPWKIVEKRIGRAGGAKQRMHGLELAGNEVVDIGSWEGRGSHALSIRLSPLTIRCCLDDRQSLETWWQNEKCVGRPLRPVTNALLMPLVLFTLDSGSRETRTS
jgi:hypothetical protein